MARSIEQVTTALTNIGKLFIIDDASKSIETCRMETGNVTIVTSEYAIHKYDTFHPERILCIIVKNNRFYVCVKNRVVDLEATLRFWIDKEMPKMECGVCYKGTSKKRLLTGAMCGYCMTFTCIRCRDRISEGGLFKCPYCRTWELDGVEYGIPHDQLNLIEPTVLTTGPAKLCDLVSQLDGLVTIIPSIAGKIDTRNISEVCRLSFTNRFTTDGVRLGKVRKSLQELVDRFKSFRVYLLRSTYMIDEVTKNPVEEASAFIVTRDELIQYRADAWIDVLPIDQNFNRVIVEYLQPQEFEVPPSLKDLFFQVNTDYSFHKTWSIVAHDGQSANFDVDKDGKITTMTVPMLAGYLAYKCGQKLLLTCRIFDVDDSDKEMMHASLLTFEYDGAETTRLSPEQCKAIFKKDRDGLKSSKRIARFL